MGYSASSSSGVGGQDQFGQYFNRVSGISASPSWGVEPWMIWAGVGGVALLLVGVIALRA